MPSQPIIPRLPTRIVQPASTATKATPSAVTVAPSQPVNPNTGVGVATPIAQGTVEITVAAVNPANPVAVGDNDPRVQAATPTQLGVSSPDNVTIGETLGVYSLLPTTVTPGSYTATNLTVDADGRITAASNGSGGGGGTVTAVTGTAPVASSGGTTPVISMTQSSGSVNGWLSSTDWTTFNGKLTSPLTTLGDILYENATPAAARLVGNTTTVKQYLSQTGTGAISAPPIWAQVAFADISGLVITTQGGTGVSNPGTSAHILVGQGTTYADKAVSGDSTITSGGAMTNVAVQGVPYSATSPTTNQVYADVAGTMTPVSLNTLASGDELIFAITSTSTVSDAGGTGKQPFTMTPTCIIPAGLLAAAGDQVSFTGAIALTSSASLLPTRTYELDFGGASVATFPAVTLPVSLASAGAIIWIMATVLTTGTSGTVRFDGQIILPPGVGGAAVAPITLVSVVSTVNTTINNTVTFAETYSSTTAGNSDTLNQFSGVFHSPGGTANPGVTSIAMTGDGTVLNSAVTGSPITSTGTLAPTLKTQVNNSRLSNESGGTATPSFNTGVTPAAWMPALTGDITTAGGALATTLKNTGTAGTYGDSTHYPIITTDAQGRVTTVTTQVVGGGGISPTDYISGCLLSWTSTTALSVGTGTAYNPTATAQQTITGAISVPYTFVSQTDLTIDATNNQKVTSVAHSFTAGDIGSTVNVTAGTLWTTGIYIIVGVTGGAALLHKSPSAAANVNKGTYTLKLTASVLYGTFLTSVSTAIIQGPIQLVDLKIDATVNTLVSSVSYTFVASNVGQYIQITAGTSWTVGFYLIQSVSGGKATLATSPSAAANLNAATCQMSSIPCVGGINNYAGSAGQSVDGNVYRYMGAALTTSANLFYNFLMTGSPHAPQVLYRVNANLAPFILLNGGTATTSTSVNANTVVPASSKLFNAQVTSTAGASDGVAFGTSDGFTPVGATGNPVINAGGSATIANVPCQLMLDNSQKFLYCNASSTSTTILCGGYQENR